MENRCAPLLIGNNDVLCWFSSIFRTLEISVLDHTNSHCPKDGDC